MVGWWAWASRARPRSAPPALARRDLQECIPKEDVLEKGPGEQEAQEVAHTSSYADLQECGIKLTTSGKMKTKPMGPRCFETCETQQYWLNNLKTLLLRCSGRQ